MKTNKLHKQGRELKTQQAACTCGSVELELGAKCQDCVHDHFNNCQVDKNLDLNCLSERFYPPGEPGSQQYCQFFLCHRCEVDWKNEVKVTGRAYGWDADNNTIDFEEGKIYPYLRVASQFGWEDGCQDREKRILKNVRCRKVNRGSPHHVAGCYFDQLL